MEFGLCRIGVNGKRRMGSNRSDHYCSLFVFNEWMVYPIECTSLWFASSVDYLDSIYHIPNGMFYSSHSYLFSSSWMVCTEWLISISFWVLFHLMCYNDLDCNPFSPSTVHMDLSTMVCLLLFYILIPMGCLCPSFSWFLFRCWSPACHNAHRVYVLHVCCLNRFLLLTLERILFFNSMEMEWGIQQHLYWQGHHWDCEHDEWDSVGPQNPSMSWGCECCCW